MVRFLWFLLFLYSFWVSAQDELTLPPPPFKPTDDSALVNFIITDLDSVPLERAKLVVSSTDKIFKKEFISDKFGNCYTLLPEGKIYTMVVYKFGTDFPFDGALPVDVEPGAYSIDQVIRIKIIRDYSRIFTLENVYFDVNKWDIKPECAPHIDNLYNTLMINPKMKIELGGHTDSDGDDVKNLILSQNRAEAVMQYLIKKGLDPNRVSAKGYGEQVPLVPNTTPENKAKNRRTEVRVLDE
ncbi:MAG: OmpA family protein [Cytophagaceae bacterium]|jgi:outer membrane protein OmpA-like peptidoglycan-associated protein|nr:OmpA family protein [Cytophagaceae bacterium]